MAATRIYSPQLGTDIDQGVSSLGSLFAPPTAQQIQVQGTIANQQATQAAQAQARSNIQSGNGTPADYATLGSNSPAEQSGIASMFDFAKKNPNMAPAALDGQNYAIRGDASKTFVYQQSQPLDADKTRIVPTGNANFMGVPQVQTGTVKLGDDNVRLSDGTIVSAPAGEPEAPATTDALAAQIAAADYKRRQAAAGGVLPANDPIVAASLNRLAKTGAGVNVAVNNGDGSAGGAIEKEFGTSVGKTIAGDVQKGTDADERLSNSATMRAAIQSGGDNLTFGPFSKFALTAKKAIGSVIGQDLPGTSEADVINNVGFGLAAAAAKAINARGGTQAEFARAIESKPGLTMSRTGALASLDLLDQHAKADQQIAIMATDPTQVQTAQGTTTTRGALVRGNYAAAKADYYAKHPLMSPFNPGQPFGGDDINRMTQAAQAAGVPGTLAPSQSSSVAVGPANGAQSGAAQAAGGAAPATKTIGSQTYTKGADGNWYAGQ